MSKTLKIGDKVNWRGSFGSAPVEKATVDSIEIVENHGDKYGAQVESVGLDKLREKLVIFGLTSEAGREKWAYAEQVAPIGNDPDDWHHEA